MDKICCIGDRDSIKGFAALGIDTFICEDEQSAENALKNASVGGYGIIYITEQLAAKVEKSVDKIDKIPLVSVVPIPSVTENNKIGFKRLSAAVEKAVGSDIIFNKEKTK